MAVDHGWAFEFQLHQDPIAIMPNTSEQLQTLDPEHT